MKYHIQKSSMSLLLVDRVFEGTPKKALKVARKMARSCTPDQYVEVFQVTDQGASVGQATPLCATLFIDSTGAVAGMTVAHFLNAGGNE